MDSHVLMLDVLEQTLHVSPSSCWTRQKTKGLGWRLVTVAGEHTREAKTPRARRTSVVVEFLSCGLQREQETLPRRAATPPGGRLTLQFFGPSSEQTVRAFRETWRAQRVSEQRAHKRAGLPDLGHGHSCALFFGEYRNCISSTFGALM